jgi:hypothetical protein
MKFPDTEPQIAAPARLDAHNAALAATVVAETAYRGQHAGAAPPCDYRWNV